jgi:sugar phosphate isomerase/epimerase
VVSNYKFNDYWAVTMFSFTNELLDGHTPAMELIDEVLTAGLAKNIEIDGPMHFRHYPTPSAAEVATLTGLLSRHQAKISLLGGAVDRAISSTRMVDSDIVLTSIRQQLALAAELGAFGLRLMVGSLSPSELKQLAPIAESLDVRILFELHGVMSAESDIARECLALVQEINSTHVRLMCDSSLFMRALPSGLLNAFGALGVNNADEID